MSELQRAIAKAIQSGHVLEHDPPVVSWMNRFTCKQCGHAVLGNYEVSYGRATEIPCTTSATNGERKG